MVGIVIAQKLFFPVVLVLPLVHSSNVIKWNSEPEKCYPTNSAIGNLPSILITKNVIIEVY